MQHPCSTRAKRRRAHNAPHTTGRGRPEAVSLNYSLNPVEAGICRIRIGMTGRRFLRTIRLREACRGHPGEEGSSDMGLAMRFMSTGPPRPIQQGTLRRVARTFAPYRSQIAWTVLSVLASATLGLLSAPFYLKIIINQACSRTASTSSPATRC